MKKLLSLTLALLMVFSLATVALATTTDSTKPVVKVVTGDNAPEETYTFTVTAVEMTDTPSSVEDQPEIPSVTIKTGTTTEAASSEAFDLSAITEIGIYSYTIAETAGKAAGITYDDTTYTLKVTAYYDKNGDLQKDIAIYNSSDDKVENAEFTNIYTANTLTVTKSVTGNLGDKDQEFSFTVTFENPDEAKEWTNAITYNEGHGATNLVINDNIVTFTLSNADSITFSNIPDGIKYTVTEAAATGYTTYVNVADDDHKTNTASDTFEDDKVSEAASVTIINDKTVEVETGITLDSVPFILILSVCAVAVVLFVIKRRNTVEF